MADKAGLAEFFHIWAKLRGWKVPAFHYQVCQWLEHRGELAVLMMSRGFGKSTLLAIYNAWRYYRDPGYRILHQGDQDGTAHKTARDTKAVLLRHPLTRSLRDVRGEVSFWWVPGAQDERNPSMQAAGILSNITSSRADEVQNDDVEVPRNIAHKEARDKLRYRLSEQTHILVPGGRTLYVGTPHTSDSLYTEQIRMGADVLRIKLFEHEHRIDSASTDPIRLPFVPEFVFEGIGERARLLTEGQDYRLTAAGLLLVTAATGALIDCYAGCAWPERFDRAELSKRRRRCRTINEWDSQYQLHAKPLTQVRLDPDKLIVYDEEPKLREVNGVTFLLLGRARIMSATLRMDPASGKVNSDVSALCLILQDQSGNLYWHRAIALLGELAEPDDEGTIRGGQVEQICDVVERFHLSRIDVEDNGIGGHVPAILRGALKRRRLQCAVRGVPARGSKNEAILQAMEPPLRSGYLWAHSSVAEVVSQQMKEWNPAVADQPDDYLDAAARAILSEPARIGQRGAGEAGRKSDGIPSRQPQHDWRPSGGVHEVELDLT